jgi:hypothetical protein
LRADIERSLRRLKPERFSAGPIPTFLSSQTRNIRDFDFMNQIMPSGRVLFYRTP